MPKWNGSNEFSPFSSSPENWSREISVVPFFMPIQAESSADLRDPNPLFPLRFPAGWKGAFGMVPSLLDHAIPGSPHVAQ